MYLTCWQFALCCIVVNESLSTFFPVESMQGSNESTKEVLGETRTTSDKSNCDKRVVENVLSESIS